MAKFPIDKTRFLYAGVGFQLQTRITLAASATVDYVLDLEAADGYCIYGMPISAGTTDGLVYLDTFNATSYTGGTVLESIRLNENADIESVAKFYSGATTTGSSNLREYCIGTSSTNQSSGGGFVTSGEIKILETLPLVFRFSNQETSENVISFGYTWFECNS